MYSRLVSYEVVALSPNCTIRVRLSCGDKVVEHLIVRPEAMTLQQVEDTIAEIRRLQNEIQ